jgi:hypothetical protein
MKLVRGLRLLPLVFATIVLLTFHRHLMDWYYHIHLPSLSTVSSLLPHHDDHPHAPLALAIAAASLPSHSVTSVVKQLSMFTMPGGQQICQGAANAWQPFSNLGHPTTGEATATLNTAVTGSLSAEPGSTLGGDVWSSAASTTEGTKKRSKLLQYGVNILRSPLFSIHGKHRGANACACESQPAF